MVKWKSLLEISARYFAKKTIAEKIVRLAIENQVSFR